MNYGEKVTRAALKNLPHGKFSITEEQDNGQFYSVTVEITDDEFIVDLRDNPDQDKGPFNISRDSAVTSSQLILKSLTSTDTICNGGTFRPLKVLTREGSVFAPKRPAAMGIYYEIDVRLYDLIWRVLAENMPERLPAGGFQSICGTLFGGVHPDTGRQYSIIEPELGGWGGSARMDGNTTIFSGFHGETYNCPAEINEARNGLYVDRMSLNDDDGGEGKNRGGKGVCIEYRIRSDNAWFTAAYTRSKFPPWPLEGGNPGSPNYVEIVRKDGTTDRYSVVNALTLNTDDIIRIKTGNGAGWGRPEERDIELVKDDLKNGYITEEVADKIYKLSERS
jgi:N-methylhydantoinase B